MDWLELAKTTIPGVVTAILAAVITVHLAFKRTTREKWWEKKYEAYASLLEALHHLKNYAAEYYELQFTDEALSEEKHDELAEDLRVFSRELKKLTDLAAFRLSAEAKDILDEYRREERAAQASEEIFEAIEGSLEASKKCLQKLTDAAKRDLGVK